MVFGMIWLILHGSGIGRASIFVVGDRYGFSSLHLRHSTPIFRFRFKSTKGYTDPERGDGGNRRDMQICYLIHPKFGVGSSSQFVLIIAIVVYILLIQTQEEYYLSLRDDYLQSGYAGTRPKICGPGKGYADFII
ncbi:hypothetical protein L1987_71220 [Smallanthus sonchifolius]|uniref:Uncharacterized protein n=1 Tax=Smallanthus sonchifolius TaxID=185202 RepID=A0ACB9ASG6_9ASTR|nr:hypothetical protein L1987_71220 [Smallanthus sonchifolius]